MLTFFIIELLDARCQSFLGAKRRGGKLVSKTDYADVIDWVNASSAISEMGITLTTGRNFSEFDQALSNGSGRHPVLRQFKAQLKTHLFKWSYNV